MDARLKLSSGMIIVGPSQSGKTVWCKRLIQCSEEVFDRPVNKIYWYYGIWNPGLREFQEAQRKRKNPQQVFVREGMPQSMSEIEPDSIVVLDDLLQGDFTEMFTKWTHHIPCFCIKISQNYYFKPKDRTANINAQYIVLFKYPGDKLLIQMLARQMKKPWLTAAYEEATRKPYSYLLIDLNQTTPDDIRIRSQILPGEGLIEVYKGKK